MDVQLINAFVRSIDNVFRTMLGVNVRVNKPVRSTGHPESVNVSGVIGISGSVQGAVVLNFTDQVATRVASKLTGGPIAPQSPDLVDAVGELANMVAGGAKAEFGDGESYISLPTVVLGNGHHVAQTQDHPVLTIPCSTPLGDFSVDVSLVAVTAAAT